MSLNINEKAPDFSLPDTSGRIFSLYKDNKKKPLIIYFYPKDFTPVCTKEACSFRDHFDIFRNLDIDIFGISMDTVDNHKLFKEKHNLPFELLADVSGKVSKSYGAKLPFLSMPKRITYLLDSNLMVKAKYSNLIGHESHVKAMVEALKES